MLSLLKFMINFETWTFSEQHLLIYRKNNIKHKVFASYGVRWFQSWPSKWYCISCENLIPDSKSTYNFSHTVLQLAGVTDRLDVRPLSSFHPGKQVSHILYLPFFVQACHWHSDMCGDIVLLYCFYDGSLATNYSDDRYCNPFPCGELFSDVAQVGWTVYTR